MAGPEQPDLLEGNRRKFTVSVVAERSDPRHLARAHIAPKIDAARQTEIMFGFARHPGG
jgi:hypothetical protein